MKQRFPFAIKLGLSFAIVILVSVALVYFFTATGITTRFATFSEQNKQQIARQVCSLLGEYRARTGNWIGVNQLLSSQQTIFHRAGPGRNNPFSYTDGRRNSYRSEQRAGGNTVAR